MAGRLNSISDAFQSQIHANQAKINAINDRLVPLAEEITEAEETLVKTVEQYHVDFIKFTEQLRKTDLLKQKHEKLSTGLVADQKKLRDITKQLTQEKSESSSSNDKLKKADAQQNVVAQNKLKILDMKIREKERRNEELKSERENFFRLHPKINM